MAAAVKYQQKKWNKKTYFARKFNRKVSAVGTHYF